MGRFLKSSNQHCSRLFVASRLAVRWMLSWQDLEKTLTQIQRQRIWRKDSKGSMGQWKTSAKNLGRPKAHRNKTLNIQACFRSTDFWPSPHRTFKCLARLQKLLLLLQEQQPLPGFCKISQSKAEHLPKQTTTELTTPENPSQPTNPAQPSPSSKQDSCHSTRNRFSHSSPFPSLPLPYKEKNAEN